MDGVCNPDRPILGLWEGEAHGNPCKAEDHIRVWQRGASIANATDRAISLDDESEDHGARELRILVKSVFVTKPGSRQGIAVGGCVGNHL